MKQSESISVDETAERLGIPRGLAYRAIKAGEIPFVRIGKRFLVVRSAVDSMLKVEPQRANDLNQTAKKRKAQPVMSG